MGKARKNARVKKTNSSVSKPYIAAKTSKSISKNVKKDNVTEYDDISKFYAVVHFLESKGLFESATSLRTELGEKLNVSLWTVGAVLKFGSMNRVEFALAKAEEAGKAAAAAAACAAAIAEEELSSSDENSDSSDEEGVNPAETGRKIVSSSSTDSSSGEGSHNKTEKAETQKQKKSERNAMNTDSSSDESSDDSDGSSDDEDESAQVPVKKTKQVDTSSSSSDDSSINEKKNSGKDTIEGASNLIHNISHSSSSSSSSSSESDSSDDSSSEGKGKVCTPKAKAHSVRDDNIAVSDVSDVEVSDTDVSSSDDSSGEQNSSSSDNESDDEDSSDEESSDDEEVNARIAAKKKAAEAKAKAAAAAAASWRPTPPKKNVNLNVEKGTDGAQALSSGKPFTRVDSDYWGEVATNDGGAMADNSYGGAFGSGGFGSKSSEKLLQVQGKRFQHEKTKRKRSFNGFARTGGAISQDSFSTKFCYSDDEN